MEEKYSVLNPLCKNCFTYAKENKCQDCIFIVKEAPSQAEEAQNTIGQQPHGGE